MCRLEDAEEVIENVKQELLDKTRVCFVIFLFFIGYVSKVDIFIKIYNLQE